MAKYDVGKTGASPKCVPASEMVPALKSEPPGALRGQGLDQDPVLSLVNIYWEACSLYMHTH